MPVCLAPTGTKFAGHSNISVAKMGVGGIKAGYSGSHGVYDGAWAFMRDSVRQAMPNPSKIGQPLEKAIHEITHTPHGRFDGEGGGDNIVLSVQATESIHQSFRYVIETRHNDNVTL